MLKDQIAQSLEVAFSRYGFAEPSVAKLKTECNVSLRTLYKHYPSKEAMIVGALEFRHRRYLTFLECESEMEGLNAAVHIFERLEKWMKEFAPFGCMSLNAIAAFPDNPLINQAVKLHKEEVRNFLGRMSGREDLADELFLLHEGASSAWLVFGEQAIHSATNALTHLLKGD